jgi:hypothetical protein
MCHPADSAIESARTNELDTHTVLPSPDGYAWKAAPTYLEPRMLTLDPKETPGVFVERDIRTQSQ